MIIAGLLYDNIDGISFIDGDNNKRYFVYDDDCSIKLQSEMAYGTSEWRVVFTESNDLYQSRAENVKHLGDTND